MCHVLIIEDDAIAALDIREALRDHGASSFSFAETEREAIASAREHLPAVITSDVMLASGFGPRAVKAIREEYGQIPVIFITATPEACDGCEEGTVLEKPFCPDRLAQTFATLAPH